MARTQITATALVISLLFLAGCTSYQVGSRYETEPNGSYTESTLNSPVADQNSHVGGDPSYPASVSDQGKPLATPDKLDGR
ncbi:MAG: hypothetical protein LV479_02205 [Methylacidiphilales bacterium]|nr:hypothetical protein [Candidatus Methylacidiphilales bacterium]